MSLIGKIKIAAASETERILILKDWNISPLPGKYDVLISFKYGAFVGTGPELYLAPVNIKMEVVNRDYPRIRQECDSAKSLYLSARSYTEAANATNLLSKFTDSSALECLTKAYYSGSPYHFKYMFIHAIGGIGTDDLGAS